MASQDEVHRLARAMFIAQAEQQEIQGAEQIWEVMVATGQAVRWTTEAIPVVEVLHRDGHVLT